MLQKYSVNACGMRDGLTVWGYAGFESTQSSFTYSHFLSFQSYARAFVARKKFLRLRKYVIKIQAFFRGCIVRCQMFRMRKSAKTIQTRFRCYKKTKNERENFLHFKKAAATIQNEWRRWKQRNGVEYIIWPCVGDLTKPKNTESPGLNHCEKIT